MMNDQQQSHFSFQSLSSDFTNFVQNPLNLVEQIYEQQQLANTGLVDLDSQLSSKLLRENVCHFHQELKRQLQACLDDDPSKLQQIPFLNGRTGFHDGLRNRSLIRLQCMVQDMFNNEVYIPLMRTAGKQVSEAGSAAAKRRINLYTDTNLGELDDVDFFSGTDLLLDRFVYYGISIPGLNQWVQDEWSDKQTVECKRPPSMANFAHDLASVKRKLNSAEDAFEPMQVSTSQAETTSSLVAPSITSDNNSDDLQGTKKKRADLKSNDDNKNSKQDQDDELTPIESCFPLQSKHRANRSCIVKIYDEQQESAIKLNDVIEVIGMVEFEDMAQIVRANAEQQTTSSESTSQIDADVLNGIQNLGIEKDDYNNYPYLLVPRIHAILVRSMPQVCPLPELRPEQNMQQICQIKMELHSLFTDILFGDEVAAEYLICWLISKVYARKDMLPIGNFPLNLTHIPLKKQEQLQLYINCLYSLLQQFCSHSHLLPLEIASLNKESFQPHRSKSGSKIIAGLLQLPANLMLLIDETAMQPGKLTETGIHNLQSLKEMMQFQTVEYNQLYYRHQIDSNVNVLVMSEGRSLLEVQCQVPIKASEKKTVDAPECLFESLDKYLSEPLVSSIRRYVHWLREVKHEFSADVKESVQNDFVAMRRQSACSVDGSSSSRKFNADDLHLLINLARLLAISSGSQQLTIDFWDKAKALELERRSRLEPANK